MAPLTTEATTPTASLRRAVGLIERLQLPADVGVNMTGGNEDCPAAVDLHPRNQIEYDQIWRRMGLHTWTRDVGWTWITLEVDGVEVVLHDVREGL